MLTSSILLLSSSLKSAGWKKSISPLFKQARRQFSEASVFLPQLLDTPGSCILPRGVIRLWGPDAGKFLHGMCTGDALSWSTNPNFRGAFTSFLTSYGRIMYDSFVYNGGYLVEGKALPDPPRACDHGFLIDCDRRAIGDFILYLKWYRLRAQVEFEDLTHQWAILASWNQPTTTETTNVYPSSVIDDQRCNWQMKRTCLPKSVACTMATDNYQIYDLLRMRQGIPEGCGEITRRTAIPFEYNLDLMGALDGHKGCYLGQELISRTMHRGVVRKRVIPIQLYEWRQSLNQQDFKPDPLMVFSAVEAETDLIPVEPRDANCPEQITALHPKNSFGKLVSMVGNMGLALVRLEALPPHGLFAVHRPHPEHQGDCNFILGRAVIPDWWPDNVKPTTPATPSSSATSATAS